jgi:hypothetical protein
MFTGCILAAVLTLPCQTLQPGTQVIIEAGVPMATSYLWVDDMYFASKAHDKIGMDKLVQQGRVVAPDNDVIGIVLRSLPFLGTRSNSDCYEVRVDEAKVCVFPGNLTPITPEFLARRAEQAKVAAHRNKLIQRKVRNHNASSKLSPAEREAQIQANLAKTKESR